MNDRQSFLMRWSRRKSRGTAGDADQAANVHASKASNVSDSVSVVSESQPTIDLASLPPIESIDAGTDIRGFLAMGVPPELTRAALRRAWTSDSAIRDFVGLSENSWDFNSPCGIPGFGSIAMLDVQRLVTQVLGQSHCKEVPPSTPQPEQCPPEVLVTEENVLDTETAALAGSAQCEKRAEQHCSTRGQASQREASSRQDPLSPRRRAALPR
jgi:hypothetical protein